MQPFDYTLTVDDPVKAAIAGYNAGLDGQATRAEMARREELVELEGRRVDQGDRRIDLAERQFGAQQAQLAAAQEAQAAEMARVRQMQSDFLALASNEKANSQDYAAMVLKYPQFADELKSTYEMQSEERRKNDLTYMVQLYSALVSEGDNEVARGMLQERHDAARAAGLGEEAAVVKANLEMLDAAPEAVKFQLGMAIKALDDEGRFDGVLDAGTSPIRSSKILSDGTTILVRDQGPQVISATGEVLEGDDAQAAIQRANEEEARLAGTISAAREGGKLETQIEKGGEAAASVKAGQIAQDQSVNQWETYGKLQKSVGTIERAIQAIDDGAKTGAVEKYFVNITEASATLQNEMDRMGLDVIGSVTFGALSEGELRLAMETAVPRNLDEKELRSWLVKRRDAQLKAAAMVLDAAEFLSEPGNTINDWIKKNKSEKSNPATPPQADLEAEVDALFQQFEVKNASDEVAR